MYIFFKKNYITLMLKFQNINCIESRIIKLLSQNKLAIFLDIDGTLIPYANHPNNIIVPKNLKYLLYNLRNKLNGALALISGRMVQDIQNIINPLKLSVSGIHGLEYTNNHGQYLRNNIEPIPLDIYKRLYTFSKNYPGSMIEKKNISVALHYRNAPGIEKKATSVINRIISGSDLKLLKGNKVLELVPKNSNKGKAINFFMNKQPFLNKIPVFIGDDVTDEYGFKSVNNLGGYSIKVGYQSNTLANFFIKDTTSVLKFLNFVSFCSKKIRCQSLKLNHLYRGLN